MNKIKFEPYDDLTDLYNENSSQDPHSQIENDETPGAEYPNKNDSEDTKKQNTCNSQLYAKNITR